MSKCRFFHKWGPWGGDWLSTQEDGTAVIKTQRVCARCGEVQVKVKLKLGE